MEKKLFIIADIHGCYDEMKKALDDAGFDENNDEHLLINAGDSTDRGEQVLAVLEYLYNLEQKGKCINIRGNHTRFIQNFLEGHATVFDYMHNGLNETIADLWHRTAPFESWCMLDSHLEMNIENYNKWSEIARAEINYEYPWLLPWLKSLPYYVETKKYIITHGQIDPYASNWRQPLLGKYGRFGWEACTWADETWANQYVPNREGKVIICGHFGTQQLRNILDIDKDNEDIYAPLYIYDGNKELEKIFIDATTIISHKVNVLVIEDEIVREEDGKGF